MSDNPQPFDSTSHQATEEVASPRSVAGWWLLTCIVIGAIAYFLPSFAFKALVFVGVLSVLVFVHELGHFQLARWAGMKVNRFAIGFPPRKVADPNRYQKHIFHTVLHYMERYLRDKHRTISIFDAGSSTCQPCGTPKMP